MPAAANDPPFPSSPSHPVSRAPQLSKLHNQDVSVCIIEKGAQVGESR